MNKMREYLKPYRCFGGLMLFLFVYSLIFQIISIPLFGLFIGYFDNIDLTLLINELLMLISIITAIFVYYVGYLIFVKKYKVKFIEYKEIKSKDILNYLIIIIVSLALIRLIWFISTYCFNLLGINIENDKEVVGIFSFLYIVICAPILEEMVFRGWSISLLRSYGPISSIIFSSLAFGLIHANIYQTIPAIIIGIILAFIAYKYKTIIPTIIIHLASNFMSLFQIYEENYFWLNIYFIIAFIGILLFIFKNIKIIKNHLNSYKTLIKLSTKSISFILYVILTILIIIQMLKV